MTLNDSGLPFIGAVASYVIEKHKGQKYAGKRWPWHYAAHSVAVALRLTDPYDQIVALLHDVLEDTPTSGHQLCEMVGSEIVSYVAVLTRTGQTYREYIRIVAGYPVARRVKIADLRENLACCRRPDAPDVATSLITRYEWALAYLEERDAIG
jgi:hypothetical protein